jgi:putative acetyltransferase
MGEVIVATYQRQRFRLTHIVRDIRTALSEDSEMLTTVWLDSVRATHHFLGEEDVQALLPLVSAYLKHPGHDLWVLCDDGIPVGFMGIEGPSVQSLFIAPGSMRRGGGRALLAHARALAKGPLTADVNEQNVQALAFYRASGFSIVGRSPTDDQGRPYPLVHMRECDGTTSDGGLDH